MICGLERCPRALEQVVFWRRLSSEFFSWLDVVVFSFSFPIVRSSYQTKLGSLKVPE